MKIEQENIAKRIKQLREELGLSQLAFAEMVGAKAKINVSQWETARAIPNYVQLIEIALLCNTTIDWIITGIGDRYASIIVKEMEERFAHLEAKTKEVENENANLRTQLANKLVSYSLVSEPKSDYTKKKNKR